jgi:predicted MPP superfamily phosphohydrolase
VKKRDEKNKKEKKKRGTGKREREREREKEEEARCRGGRVARSPSRNQRHGSTSLSALASRSLRLSPQTYPPRLLHLGLLHLGRFFGLHAQARFQVPLEGRLHGGPVSLPSQAKTKKGGGK